MIVVAENCPGCDDNSFKSELDLRELSGVFSNIMLFEHCGSVELPGGGPGNEPTTL